jgi:hypothetical protein
MLSKEKPISANQGRHLFFFLQQVAWVFEKVFIAGYTGALLWQKKHVRFTSDNFLKCFRGQAPYRCLTVSVTAVPVVDESVVVPVVPVPVPVEPLVAGSEPVAG